jgi:hypothetical protein
MAIIPLLDENIMGLKQSRYKDLGKLHSLLLKACPPDSHGKQSIPTLATALGISHQYVYKWVTANKVPPAFVMKIVNLSQGRTEVKDFHPYVFG